MDPTAFKTTRRGGKKYGVSIKRINPRKKGRKIRKKRQLTKQTRRERSGSDLLGRLAEFEMSMRQYVEGNMTIGLFNDEERYH